MTKETSFQTPLFSLSNLTMIGCSIPELIYIAARAGYDAVSPRLIKIGIESESSHPIDKNMKTAIENALKITGISVYEIELARITDDIKVENLEPSLAFGEELNAKSLIVSAWTHQQDRAFIIKKFKKICQLAKKYHLSVTLEFPTFSKLTNLKDVLEVVSAVNEPNAGILIDTLYLKMSEIDYQQLSEISSQLIKSIQICDVELAQPQNAQEMIEIARNRRLIPGMGCIDFVSILKELPEINFSIECPNQEFLNKLGHEEYARQLLIATKNVIDLAKRLNQKNETLSTIH